MSVEMRECLKSSFIKALFKVNDERRKLFEDVSRNERMLKESEKNLEDQTKMYELEKSNYGEICSSFCANF